MFPIVADTSKVKVACYKDGVESIFYDNTNDLIEVYDLILKQKIRRACLIDNTQEYLFDVLYPKKLQLKYMSLEKMINDYQKDRREEIPLDRVYIVTQLEEFYNYGSGGMINTSDVDIPRNIWPNRESKHEYLVYKDKNNDWILLEKNAKYNVHSVIEFGQYNKLEFTTKEKESFKTLFETDIEKLPKSDIIQKYREYKYQKTLEFLKQSYEAIHVTNPDYKRRKYKYDGYEYTLKLARKMHENKNIS